MSIAFAMWNEQEQCFYLASDTCAGTGPDRRIGYRKTFHLKNNVWFSATGRPAQITGFETKNIYSMEELMVPPLMYLVKDCVSFMDLFTQIRDNYFSLHDELSMIIVGFDSGKPRLIQMLKNSTKLIVDEAENKVAVIGTPQAQEACDRYTEFWGMLHCQPIDAIVSFFDMIVDIQIKENHPISVSRPYNIFKVYSDHSEHIQIPEITSLT